MTGILTGFAIIATVVAAGYVCARLRIGGVGAQEALNRIAFFVAIPALLFTIISEADLGTLLSAPLLVQASAAVLAAGAFLVVSAVRLRLTASEATVGAVASGYVNANNIGLPVAAYVLGDATVVVPVILLQLLILAPITLTLLDAQTSGQVSWRFVLMQPLRNPIILASVAGALVSGFGGTVPAVVREPLVILGGAAIPMMLMAFGMSLHGSRPLHRDSSRAAAATSSVVKAVVMPVLAFVLARYAFRLDDAAVLTSVLLAGLPTAQNVYNYAARYRRGEILARDTILVTTLSSPATLLVAAALLG
ncbi:Auxin Efflux Carrier [Xylanimonas cellulosilytica DSM 15894]|uniref:Auxin Efflux Carrier n=1 Tax=Xylanimonas cellulosilytica (strain DSM 15894 / JCM 12276 / CECT 5975 / KCTC 9989 / LMG 20990 / NBRC 107835 / XIL07) TaxID=446471 RepID=D1BYX0_XYLCX|nr:AEC family transporter [Xylanimonas cellulosilytica]ACZ30045.1 Auxin Efflux Carrier [Xylanimonas cellulosilytica DSM 15894]